MFMISIILWSYESTIFIEKCLKLKYSFDKCLTFCCKETVLVKEVNQYYSSMLHLYMVKHVCINVEKIFPTNNLVKQWKVGAWILHEYV